LVSAAAIARAGLAEGNPFNGSHLNFAEQAGVRWRRSGHREGVEFSFGHFSNLGKVRANIGQNFIDLALVF
jgi:Lipid A 3-O-deacylase (PagL)